MKVAVVGAGYVGVCTGVALAELGHEVRLLDVDAAKVASLAEGRAPFHEPGLEEALGAVVRAGRASAATDARAGAAWADVVLLAVGTPSAADGSLDLRHVEAAARDAGEGLRGRRDFPVVAVKSTVLPGTARNVVAPAVAAASGLAPGRDVGVGSNPEFLAEGSALRDARAPDRVVVGADDARTRDRLLELWAKVDAPKVAVDTATAELAKYASNAFLAARVALANEVANLAERAGADSEDVLHIVGLDRRIGPHFLRAGAGFGGSCFPKDLAALAAAERAAGLPDGLLAATLAGNARQPLEVVRILEEELGSLAGRRVALLGLAFKTDTDDVRETRALPIFQALRAKGATVVVHDPLATRNFLALAPDAVAAPTVEAALAGADAAVLQLEHDAYRKVDPRAFAALRAKLVVDGRRNFRPADFAGTGVRYRAIGLGRREP